MRKTLMAEACDLIAFYDQHGSDWTSALAFTLCRGLFGSDFRIVNPEQASIRWKRRYPGRPRKSAKTGTIPVNP